MGVARGSYVYVEEEYYEDEFEWLLARYPLRVHLVNGQTYEVKVTALGEKFFLASDLKSRRQVIINKAAIAAIEVLRD